MPSIRSNQSQTTPFKSSSSLRIKRHNASSVTVGQRGLADANEARYWTRKLGLGNENKYGTGKHRKFAHPTTLTLPPTGRAVVHQLLFGPPISGKYPPLAVVAGPRVSLYGTTVESNFFRSTSKHTSSLFGNKVESDRQIPTGGHVAHCGSFRNDGRLLAVGTDAGEVRVCDVTMRATLATFKGSTLPVRSLQWFRNGQFLLAAGDDGIARVWNLSSMDKKNAILSLSGHGDVIRCTALWQSKSKQKKSSKRTKTSSSWTQLAITGSYDHTIRVWNIMDPDAALDAGDRCISVLRHGNPVEAVCLMESEDPSIPVWLLSVGGTAIKVWNPISGRCHAIVSTKHRKTITTLQSVIRSDLSDDNKTTKVSKRILTSSLDGLLQFHSWDAATGALKHLYCYNIGYSISAVAGDKSGDRFAIGTTRGEVVVKVKGSSILPKKRTWDPTPGTYSFFQRGMNADAGEDDYTVMPPDRKRRKKRRNFDTAIRQFRYGDALDYAISAKNPTDVIGVVEELGKREGLKKALSNRDEAALEPIISFISRYLSRPQFSRVLMGVVHKLIDLYGPGVRYSEVLDELFKKLRARVRVECKAQAKLLKLVGEVDAGVARIEKQADEAKSGKRNKNKLTTTRTIISINGLRKRGKMTAGVSYSENIL